MVIVALTLLGSAALTVWLLLAEVPDDVPRLAGLVLQVLPPAAVAQMLAWVTWAVLLSLG